MQSLFGWGTPAPAPAPAPVDPTSAIGKMVPAPPAPLLNGLRVEPRRKPD